MYLIRGVSPCMPELGSTQLEMDNLSQTLVPFKVVDSPPALPKDRLTLYVQELACYQLPLHCTQARLRKSRSDNVDRDEVGYV
jgi:hypothetical protein